LSPKPWHTMLIDYWLGNHNKKEIKGQMKRLKHAQIKESYDSP